MAPALRLTLLCVVVTALSMAAMVMPCPGLGWPIGDRVVTAFLHREGYCYWTVKGNTWWFVFSLAVFAFASEFGSNIIVHCVIGGGFVAVACTALLYRKPLTTVGLAMAVSYLWQRYLFFLPMPTNPYWACTMLIIMGVASVLFLQTTRNRVYCACVAFGIRLGAVIGAVWTRPSDNGVAMACGAFVFAAFVCSTIAQRWCNRSVKNNIATRSWKQVYVSVFFFEIVVVVFLFLFSLAGGGGFFLKKKKNRPEDMQAAMRQFVRAHPDRFGADTVQR